MGRAAIARAADQYAYQLALASEQGRFHAGQLANWLAAGQPPPVVAGAGTRRRSKPPRARQPAGSPASGLAGWAPATAPASGLSPPR
jgi:hypothetical protein